MTLRPQRFTWTKARAAISRLSLTALDKLAHHSAPLQKALTYRRTLAHLKANLAPFRPSTRDLPIRFITTPEQAYTRQIAFLLDAIIARRHSPISYLVRRDMDAALALIREDSLNILADKFPDDWRIESFLSAAQNLQEHLFGHTYPALTKQEAKTLWNTIRSAGITIDHAGL